MSDTAIVSNRQGIRAPGTGNGTTDPITFGSDLNGNGTLNESNDGEWIACNYLSWMDGAAYADWAGMRPMTELEYEKIGRGPTSAVQGEFAWGDTTIRGSAYTLTDGGEAGATVNNSVTAGNASTSETDGAINGPLRVGIFADASSDRQEAGASYYGVMELTGNLWERAVTVGNSTGRSFTGSHGDGSLSTNGNATNSDWPGYSGGEVTGATGSGMRGGNWRGGVEKLCVSNRTDAAFVAASVRYRTWGFRLVRIQ